nr:MAG TPA: hypothetical protein [Caudoviricetes sp.]
MNIEHSHYKFLLNEFQMWARNKRTFTCLNV